MRLVITKVENPYVLPLCVPLYIEIMTNLHIHLLKKQSLCIDNRAICSKTVRIT